MRVLLVNPHIYDFTAYDLWLRPLGLLYIAAVLKKYTDCELYWLDTLDRGFEGAVPAGDAALKDRHTDGRGKFYREIVEKPPVYEPVPRRYARYGMPMEVFSKRLEDLPDMDVILVTSLMTYWLDGVKVTIQGLRRRFRSAVIVLGGILPNLVEETHLKTVMDADIFFRGYGESKILDFIRERGGKVYGSPDLTDLDALPFPALEYCASQSAVPLITARGCPFRCTYCASNILNQRFLERGSENILEEIRFMHDTYGATDFAIFDDALLMNKGKRFLRVFGQLKDELPVRFHTPNGLHTGELDRETAETLYAAGFKTLRLSFESTSGDILARSSNKVTVRQMERAVTNLEAAGYRRQDIGVYLLFGLPGQRLSQVEEALEFAEDLGVIPYLSYFSPVPGTADFLALQKSGHLSTPVNLYETNKVYFSYIKSGFSLGEIQGIKDKTAQIIDRARRA
jgi:radical SAM superfamily enzyme YgiQ (UPF0313 family)